MTGFFGKIPASGDFVARGLLPGMRPVLDRFLTRNWADMARTPEIWPEAGLRGLLAAEPGTHAVLVIPSHDSAERYYPLAIVQPCEGADRDGVDQWANAVLGLLCLTDSADDIAQNLSHLQGPQAASTPLAPPFFWGAPDG